MILYHTILWHLKKILGKIITLSHHNYLTMSSKYVIIDSVKEKVTRESYLQPTMFL